MTEVYDARAVGNNGWRQLAKPEPAGQLNTRLFHAKPLRSAVPERRFCEFDTAAARAASRTARGAPMNVQIGELSGSITQTCRIEEQVRNAVPTRFYAV